MYKLRQEDFKTLYKSKGYTQKDVATAIGVSVDTVKGWTRNDGGKRSPDDGNIKALAKLLNTNIDQFADIDQEFKKLVTRTPSFRPFIGKASCGVPTTYYYEDVEMLPAPESSGKNAYYVEADGNSMSPRINDGDLIMCDPDVEVNHGDIVHFTWDGENGIKKYLNVGGTVMLQPLNSEYHPIIVTDAYELNMVKCVRREEKL